MELILKELVRQSVIKDRTLRKRARECARISVTKHYIISCEKEEVAYLAIDHMPGVDYILLYEIFIKENFRKRGIGSEILIRVENLGRELGYSKVVLHAQSFDKNIPKETIEAWYIKRGYIPSKSLKNALEKRL